ncbi:MAG: hypothetical protein A2049_00340 [Elusimicrobia bacterium GWA2_62_23]|nr:MAG: hypothetical protein A2049_00340 [Elusimicrobia bacterium GWA2_62_23]
MSDALPTFRRLYQAVMTWGEGFSYQDSVVTKGAVWALIGWLPVPLLCTLIQALAAWTTEVGAEVTYVPDMGMMLFMTGFPWAPLAGFVLGCVFAGRAAGWLEAVKRGLKANTALFLVLMLLAVLALTDPNEKAGLVAAIAFWLGVLAILMALFGALLRHLYDRLRA